MFDKRPRTKRELKRLFTNLKRKKITDDMAHILIDLCYNKKQVMRTSGFYWPGGPDSVLSWDDITRRFTLSPRSPNPEGEGADTYVPQFRFYSWAGEPVFHRINEELEVEIPDEEGRYVIYLDVDEETNQQSLFAKKNPDDNELARIIIKKVPVACLYWNQTSQRAEVFCDDRFGSQINPQSHWIESSSTFAKRYADGGLSFYNYTTNGDGTSESDLKFKVTPGKFWHGDFLIDVPRAGNETNIPTLHWYAGLPRIHVNNVPVVLLERLAYNSGPNVVLAVDSGKFVMYHIFATNDRVDGQHVISVAGRAQYDSLGDAYIGRKGELMTLHNEMPQSGKCYLGTFFYEVDSSFTNSAHARIVGVYSGDTHNPVSIAPGSEDYLSIDDEQKLAFDPSNLPTGGGADGREIELQENNGWVEWRYVGDSNWTQLFEIPANGEDGADGQNGTDGTDGQDGADGREIELQENNGWVEWRYVGDTAWNQLFELPSDGEDGADGEDGLSAYEVWLSEGNSGTEQEFLDSLKGEKGADGEAGLFDARSSCNDKLRLTATTDVIAIIDTTSGPYTNASNVTSVVNALTQWFSAYQADNPDFTGNLYIGKNDTERFLLWLPRLRENYASSDFTWVSGYEMTANASPEVFLICFVNESHPNYHDLETPADLDSPTTTFVSDYNDFIAAYEEMSFFGGMVYPVAGLNPDNNEAKFLMLAYAAITGSSVLSEEEFASLAGTNYDNADYDFSDTSNPFASYALSSYGWNTVLNKHTVGTSLDTLDFTSAEFASDINDILFAANDTVNQVSLIDSFIDGILSLRGLRSSSISFEVLPGGCIQMEVNGGSGSSGSEDCCENASGDLDGGFANSTYLSIQKIDGGNANG